MKLTSPAPIAARLLIAGLLGLVGGCGRHNHPPAGAAAVATATSEVDRFDVVVPSNTVVRISPNTVDVGTAAFRYDLVAGGAVRQTGRRDARDGALVLPAAPGESYLYVDGILDAAGTTKSRLRWRSFGKGTWRLYFKAADNRTDAMVVTVLFTSPDKDGAAPIARPGGAARSNPAAVTPAAPGDASWTPATEALQVGATRVEILSAVVGKAPLVNTRGEPSQSVENLLAVTLRVEHTGKTGAAQFKNWEGYNFPRGRDAVVDDAGRAYKLVAYSPLKEPAGRESGGPISPGQAKTEVLLFEAPPQGVRYVNLELPAANVGGAGTLRFQIPANMIKY